MDSKNDPIQSRFISTDLFIVKNKSMRIGPKNESYFLNKSECEPIWTAYNTNSAFSIL